MAKKNKKQAEQNPRSPQAGDRFVTAEARHTYSHHIYAPDFSDRTFCNLTVAKDLDEGLVFKEYEKKCQRGQHFAPKYYCSVCNRAYLMIHGVREARWGK